MAGIGLIFLRRGGQAHPTAGSDYILSETKGDAEVFRILMEQGVSSDGVGITKDDAARVTSFSTWFKGNTKITRFDEMIYFTKVTHLQYQAFYACTSLVSIDLSNINTFAGTVFYGCSALEDIHTDGRNWTALYTDVFVNCKSLQGDFRLDSYVSGLEYKVFANSSIRSVVLPYTTGIGVYQAFMNCTSLKYMLIGKNCTSVGTAQVFSGCSSLEALIFTGDTPCSLYSSATLSRPTNCPIYVPDEYVETYKTATNWTGQANYIKGISNLQTDLPDIYAEVVEYL